MSAIISLCSGYAGLDLGLQAVVGGTVICHVEYDPDANRVLAHHAPDVPNLGDLGTADWSGWASPDWLTAGYPCQPFSAAGKRKGTDDPRHLWPHVARAVGELRPRRVLLENVRGHLSLGFDAVLDDLASLGYDARWGVVRAADAGAPHGRARLFVVATDTDLARSQRTESARGRELFARRAIADTASYGRDERRSEPARQLRGSDAPQRSDDVDWGVYTAAIRRWEHVLGRPAPSPTERGRTGQRLSPCFVEWMQGIPDGWVTGVPGISRNAQLRILGNGVVPQQAALALSVLLPVAQEVAA